jgi:1-phosphatidylinositol phosphodiesterase
MKGIPDTMSLAHISIPGTHQSCCTEGLATATGWSNCQLKSATIPTQLKDGIRYLDLRCMVVNGEYLEIMHGDVDYRNTLTTVVKECVAFLEKNDSETIMMRIKQEGYNLVSDREFIKTFDSSLSQYKHKIHQSNSIPNLGDVRGKIVIISNVSGLTGIQWGSINHQDVSKCSVEQKKQFFLNHIDAAVKSKSNTLFINHSSIQAQGLNHVHFYANKMNAFLLDEFVAGLGTRDVDNSKNESPHTGIIPMDYYRGDVVDEIIKRNVVADLLNMPVVCLRNLGFSDHHLTSSRYHDGAQRTVYCIETYKSDNQKYWLKIDVGGNNFRLFNTYYKEFLYASPRISGGNRRHVLTFMPGKYHEGCVWRFTKTANGQYRIFNDKYKEYLYISGYSSMLFTEECNCLVGGDIPQRGEWTVY